MNNKTSLHLKLRVVDNNNTKLNITSPVSKHLKNQNSESSRKLISSAKVYQINTKSSVFKMKKEISYISQ